MSINFRSLSPRRALLLIGLLLAIFVPACGGDSNDAEQISSSAYRVTVIYDKAAKACSITSTTFPIELAGRQSWTVKVSITRNYLCSASAITLQPVNIKGDDAAVINTSEIAQHDNWSGMDNTLEATLAEGTFQVFVDGIPAPVTFEVTQSGSTVAPSSTLPSAKA